MTTQVPEMGNNYIRLPEAGFQRDELDWQDDAACAEFYAQTGYDAWFGPTEDELARAAAEAAAVVIEEGGSDELADSMAKKAMHELGQEARGVAEKICRSCPVRLECLTFAFEHDQTDGIWGGLTPYGRTQLRRNVQRERNVA